MATAKILTAEEDERVELFIPRVSANEDPNFLICVNGVSYLLPRGKKSKVPQYVAYEYNRAVKAQEEYENTVDAILTNSEN